MKRIYFAQRKRGGEVTDGQCVFVINTENEKERFTEKKGERNAMEKKEMGKRFKWVF